MRVIGKAHGPRARQIKISQQEKSMRAVIQRVSRASVSVGNRITGSIGRGLLILLGIHREDTENDVRYLVDKISTLRIFEDGNGLMNRSVLDEKGEVLVVSQFTLYGDCRKGRRPSYSSAAPPDTANALYSRFVAEMEKRGIITATGEFQAMMEVSLVNSGPVTLLVDSRKLF